MERWLALDHSQLFLTSKVTSLFYQTAQQLVTVFISLIETKQTRFAEIIWVLLIEMALLLADQELNRKMIIIRKRSRMNIWGWVGISDFSQGSGGKQWVGSLPNHNLDHILNCSWEGVCRSPFQTLSAVHSLLYLSQLPCVPQHTTTTINVRNFSSEAPVFWKSPPWSLPHRLTLAHQTSTENKYPFSLF